MGQYDGGLSRRKIFIDLSIPLATVNKVIVNCTREGKKCTASHKGHPWPSDPTLRPAKKC